MPGHRFDYDGWAEDFNLPERWFDKCLPYFIPGENYKSARNPWRRNAGRLTLKHACSSAPLFDFLYRVLSFASFIMRDAERG